MIEIATNSLWESSTLNAKMVKVVAVGGDYVILKTIVGEYTPLMVPWTLPKGAFKRIFNPIKNGIERALDVIRN